jgi:hypothetical protein
MTPRYDFNRLLIPPGDLSSQMPPHGDSSVHASDYPIVREGGFLDPTGRTMRVFRHNDHKFEWPRDEFKNWCISQAEQWGCDMQYGRAIDPNPWGRDLSPPGKPLRSTSHRYFPTKSRSSPTPDHTPQFCNDDLTSTHPRHRAPCSLLFQ